MTFLFYTRISVLLLLLTFHYSNINCGCETVKTSLLGQKVDRTMHTSKTVWEISSWPILSPILAETTPPLHYRGWKATCHLPRAFKLNLTNFQAEWNKQSRVLIVCAPFSLPKRHGPPLSHKLQCCGGTVMSSHIVKMTLMLHAWQKPDYPGLWLCQSLLMRGRLVGLVQKCSLQWLARIVFVARKYTV